MNADAETVFFIAGREERRACAQCGLAGWWVPLRLVTRWGPRARRFITEQHVYGVWCDACGARVERPPRLAPRLPPRAQSRPNSPQMQGRVGVRGSRSVLKVIAGLSIAIAKAPLCPPSQRRIDVLMQFSKRRLIGLLALCLAGVLAVSAYAFTAANTVPTHSAGAGANTVSGYTLSWGAGSGYTFSGDGLTMTAVQFNLDKAASDVKVALTTGNPLQAEWADCGGTTTGAFIVNCTFVAPVPNATGVKLSMAAVSSGAVTIGP